MTAIFLFSVVNAIALLGWIILAIGVILQRPFLRDVVAGLVWPLGFSALYTALILFFFRSAPGGFDSLAHVQLLFTSPWAALAGWVHYLAFDLFIGAWIARAVTDRGVTRLVLVLLLPLTFLFGPIGLAGFFISRLALENRKVSA